MKVSVRKLLLAGYLVLYAGSIFFLTKDYFETGYSFWEILWIAGTFGLPAVSILLYTLSYEPKHFNWFWKMVPFTLIAFNASIWYFHGPLSLNTQRPLPMTISTGFIAAGLFFVTFYLSFKFAYPQTATNRKTHLKVIIFSLIAATLCIASRYVPSVRHDVSIKVNYVAEYNKITKPINYDPNENAEPYYEKAFELYVDEPNQLSKEDLKTWPTDLSEDKRILLQNWVSANSKAIEQLKMGTEKPYYWVEHPGSSMWQIMFPKLAEARKLAKVICARARLNAFDGNSQQAFSEVAMAYQFGICFQGQKMLIDQLVGIGIDGLAIETAFQTLNRTKPEPELLKQTQQQFETLLAKHPFPLDFTCDKFMTYDAIQRLFTDDGKGDGHVYGTGFLEFKTLAEYSDAFKLAPAQARTLKNLERRQTVELVDKVFIYINSARYKTPAELDKEGTYLSKVLEDMVKDNALLHAITPAFAKVLTISYRCKTDTEALITTVAVLRYKAEKNEYPATLQELVTAGYIKELPIDAFSGEALVYKRTEDNFILYSVGENFVDDGGTHSGWGTDKGDYVFWPVQAVEPEKRN